MKQKNIIDIYHGGILDGKVKQWDAETYIALNSASMIYDDEMFPKEIRHIYGIGNQTVDVYKLSRKDEKEDCIKCTYLYQGSSNQLHHILN
jgi:hypothetical protein